jgi:hypothetical protein
MSLIPMVPADIGRLESWLGAVHLDGHWLPTGADREASVSAARNDLLMAMEEPYRAPFIMRCNGDRVGYLELLHANEAPVLSGLGLPAESLAIKLFIGLTADIGKGFGRRSVRLAVGAAQVQHSVKAVFAFPQPRIRAAVCMFKAAGFTIQRTMITSLGPSVQMVLLES